MRIIIIIIIIIVVVVVVVIVVNVFIITKLQSLSIQNNMYIQINSGDGRKCIFNDAFSTFYLRLYGVGHNMAKNHSDSKKGNPLSPLGGLPFPISSLPQTG